MFMFILDTAIIREAGRILLLVLLPVLLNFDYR